MVSNLRRTGIDVIGDVPWGTHFCQFYETSHDLIETLVPYFKEGLASNEFCMWVTSEPLQVDQATAALRSAVPDLDNYIDEGQIEILDYSQWYTRSGKFSAEEVLQGWVDKLKATQERGFEGLRLTGNTFWLEKADWDDFTKYEETVNNIIGQYPMLAICTYSLQKCNALELLDVVANHQFALIKRSGRWEIIESTRHKKIEQAMRESEEKLSALYASMVEGVALHEIIYDESENPVDYVITDINPSYEIITGLSREKALGQKASELYGLNEPPYLDIYARVASPGKPESFETYFPPMKKHFSISVFSPARGKFATVFSDITERKAAEEVLQEANEELLASAEENERLLTAVQEERDRLFALVNSISDEVWFADTQKKFTLANPSAIREFQLGTGKVDVEKFAASLEVYRPDGTPRPIGEAPPLRALMGEVVRNQEEMIRTPVSDEMRYRQVSAAPVKDANGNIIGSVSIVRDITEGKHAEIALQEANEELEVAAEELRQQNDELMSAQSALQESEEKYRTIVETANEGIWVVDSETRTTYVNRRMAEMLGYSPEELVGKKSSEFMDEDGRAHLGLLLERRQQGITESFEIKFLRKDGSHLWTISSAAPLRDKDGKFAGSLGMLVDITGRKQIDEALKESETKYRNLFINMTEEVHFWELVRDKDGQINTWRLVDANPPTLKTWGKKLEEIKGKTTDEIFGPGATEHYMSVVQKIMTEGVPYSYEDYFPNLDKYFRFTSVPLGDYFITTGADITTIKKIQEVLQESEQRYATTLASIGDAVIATDIEGRITFMNAVAEELTCWTLDDASMVPVKSVFNIINEFARQKVDDPITKVLENGAIVGLANHTILIRRDGTEVAIDDSGAPIRDRNGNITGVVLVFRDITERKRLEQSLSHLAFIVESSDDAIIGKTLDGIITSWNFGAEKMYGYSAEEVIGRPISILAPPDHPDEVPDLLEKIKNGDCVVRHETVRLRKDSRPIRVLLTISPIKDLSGNLIGASTIAHDITKLKQAEDGLRAVSEILKIANNNADLIPLLKGTVDYLKDLSHCTAIGIRLLDEAGNIPYQAYDGFSQSFYELESPLSIKSDQCMCINVIKGDVDPKLTFYTDGGSFYMNGTTRFLATVSDDDKGRTRNVCNQVGYESVALIPIRFENNILGLIQLSDPKENMVPLEMVEVVEKIAMQLGTAIVRVNAQQALKESETELRIAKDDLELKVQERTSELQSAKEDVEVANEELRVELEEHSKLEVELVKAKDAAEESVKAKSAFLANMSHELRTPMNAVLGFSSLLLDDTLTQEHKEYIEGIRKGGEALLTIINDILDFSRAEKDKIELEHQPFSLKHLIDESLDMVATQAGKKRLNLSQTINYGTPDTIIGDQGRLRQILVNLLTNAIKFTDNGDVSLSISSKAAEGDRHQIFFKVKDTGIGIPQDKMNEIFEPFVQVERTLSRKRDGVGLGLAITKQLVELMGGTIWAESIPGQGATFHFTIQAETIPDKQLDFGRMDRGIASESFPGLKPMRILVAEDNPSNQRVLVEMLKRLGYRADAVADGREVIQALERQDYDLVLMDIKMPEMDGITATQVIRKLRPENGPKIVAITAFALEGDREKCLEAGMDDYIAKPVQMRELAEVLKRNQIP